MPGIQHQTIQRAAQVFGRVPALGTGFIGDSGRGIVEHVQAWQIVDRRLGGGGKVGGAQFLGAENDEIEVEAAAVAPDAGILEVAVAQDERIDVDPELRQIGLVHLGHADPANIREADVGLLVLHGAAVAGVGPDQIGGTAGRQDDARTQTEWIILELAGGLGAAGKADRHIGEAGNVTERVCQFRLRQVPLRGDAEVSRRQRLNRFFNNLGLEEADHRLRSGQQGQRRRRRLQGRFEGAGIAGIDDIVRGQVEVGDVLHLSDQLIDQVGSVRRQPVDEGGAADRLHPVVRGLAVQLHLVAFERVEVGNDGAVRIGGAAEVGVVGTGGIAENEQVGALATVEQVDLGAIELLVQRKVVSLAADQDVVAVASEQLVVAREAAHDIVAAAAAQHVVAALDRDAGRERRIRYGREGDIRAGQDIVLARSGYVQPLDLREVDLVGASGVRAVVVTEFAQNGDGREGVQEDHLSEHRLGFPGYSNPGKRRVVQPQQVARVRESCLGQRIAVGNLAGVEAAIHLVHPKTGRDDVVAGAGRDRCCRRFRPAPAGPCRSR